MVREDPSTWLDVGRTVRAGDHVTLPLTLLTKAADLVEIVGMCPARVALWHANELAAVAKESKGASARTAYVAAADAYEVAADGFEEAGDLPFAQFVRATSAKTRQAGFVIGRRLLNRRSRHQPPHWFIVSNEEALEISRQNAHALQFDGHDMLEFKLGRYGPAAVLHSITRRHVAKKRGWVWGVCFPRAAFGERP